MDLGDLFGGLAEVGGRGRGWKGWFALSCLVLGAALGGWIGWTWDGAAMAIGGVFLGGFVGWLLGLVLRGLGIILLIALPIAAIVLGWTWLTGG